jgi:hypothetical protein
MPVWNKYGIEGRPNPLRGNTNSRGRFSAVDLHIEIACFVKKGKIFLI